MTAEEYKSERQRRGLSQTALAALVGVRQGTISDRETERIGISREAEMALLSLPIPSDEEIEIRRERRMIESGKYEPLDMSFFEDLEAKAEKLKAAHSEGQNAKVTDGGLEA